MFRVDIDYRSGESTVHRSECVHSVPDNSPDKDVDKLGKNGGWLSFPTVGDTLRYLKVNKVKGLTKYCKHCTPLSKLKPEPRAALGLKSTPTGCAMCGNCKPSENPPKLKKLQITDTKTIARRLSRKMFGSC